ncbi:TIGR03089 family protein [Aeromicrobium flavum]|uniref:TIGR03089 family protein n=1 Tax=Aeromicrobium flavum TaxID=416568 RepID=UPI001649CA8D|nr:TIGR03089 family protein [Aeromicrobium flavum]
MTPTLATVLTPTPTPVVTYYDVSTGERVELSGVTLANWVAKVANLLVDELDAERGTRIRIGLPSHWLRTVWLLGAWRIGAVVTDHDAQIGLSGPELEADEPVRLAASLRPLGGRFPTEPAGFLDTAIHVPSSPDVFVDLDPPTPDDVALDLDGRTTTHAGLLAAAPLTDRVVREPQSLAHDAADLVAALAGGGSLVIVAGAEPADLDRIAQQEHARLDDRRR